MPAAPLRSALAVLIENHLHEWRKAGNGALRIGDAGLGSAQARENPIYGTGEHNSAVPGTPLASCLELKMAFHHQMIHEMLLVALALWDPLSAQSV